MVERGGGGARVVVVATEWGDTGCRGSRSVLKEGKPGISVCGPGLTRCAGSSAEQGRWEKVAARKTEDLTVGPSCQRASGNGRARCVREGCG